MDLSKSALEDLDTNKEYTALNENLCRDTYSKDTNESQSNHEGTKEKCVNYELERSFKIESHDKATELTTTTINSKCNKWEKGTTENHLKNENSSQSNVEVETNKTDSKISLAFNIDQTSTFKVSNSSLLINVNANLCGQEVNKEHLNENKLLKPFDSSHFYETNKDVQKVMSQEEVNATEAVDEVETIEKIAEMIATSSKESTDNPKTKKRFQILMSRNYTDQNWNSHSENTHTNVDDTIQNKQNFKDSPNKKRKCVINSQIEKKVNNETSDENFLTKRRFEEIEDKLEEMFAGIEDEQLLAITKDSKKNDMEKYIREKNNNDHVEYKTDLLDKFSNCDTLTSNQSSYPTKAEKKSTSFPSSENIKSFDSQLVDQNITTITKSMLYLKTMPPRRRLSIGVNTKMLKFSMESNNQFNEQINSNNDYIEKGMSLNSLEPEIQRTKIRKDVPKPKIKSNNDRTCSEYKKEISYIKSNNRNNRTNFRKIKTTTKAKQNKKIKQRRVQNFIFSENDNDSEERPLQSRDIEIKHRSPYILVKNNGTIAVVNTVTADDSNEKWTRSKKSSNYERKTVKGCHSSTLSNKYDADTADSTWICVFCKIGPHKKGLGDLFGPYIITSDCDEYRWIKESTETSLQNTLRTGLQYSNSCDNLVINNNGSFIMDFKKTSEENRIGFILGMSKISEDCYEIWIHDECAIWAPAIFVIGSRLTGLEDATWNSTQFECVYCLKPGALLCCLQRGCKTLSHVPCAREYNWLLDETKFWVYCNNHAFNK